MAEVSIESKKLSELEKIYHLSDDDYLILERDKRSYKIKYSNLKKFIAEHLAEILGLKSMAYKDKSEFAEFSHGHDYTDFTFFPSFGPDSSNPEYPDLSKCNKCGVFRVTKYLPGKNQKQTKDIVVAVPKYKHIVIDNVSNFEKNKVGDL